MTTSASRYLTGRLVVEMNADRPTPGLAAAQTAAAYLHHVMSDRDPAVASGRDINFAAAKLLRS